MQLHNPQIKRTLLVNIARNMFCSIPGTIKIRRLILGSPFGPSSSYTESSWHERRGAQIRKILNAYLKVWGDIDWFQNKVVVELGSGNDISLPFCFALLGASKAYATDVPLIDDIALSDALRDKVKSVIAELGPHKFLIQPNIAEKLVIRKSHLWAENLVNAFSPESIDFIVSTSTLEHVPDPVLAASQMFRALRYGGRMIHAIALGNHCCGGGEKDRLAHLCYSDRVWNLRFSRRVGHNRLRWFEWKSILTEAGFDIAGHDLTIVPSADIALNRPHLAARFARMSDEQLGPSYAVVSLSKNNR
ncbi:MAG: methyltransferase domain-containing protein [Nitrospirales bacterium]